MQTTISYHRVVAEADPSEVQEEEISLGELGVADYLVFLFALDTYARYLSEAEKAPDQVMSSGINLLRSVERQHIETIASFLRENIHAPGSLRMLEAAMRQPTTVRGAGIRALKIRTVLSKGGTATTRAVFGSSTKARREVQDAIDAAMLDDADAALAKLSVIVLRNKRLEKWIDIASDTAVPIVPANINPTHEAAKAASDQAQTLITDQLQQDASKLGSEAGRDARNNTSVKLQGIQDTATEAARKALAKSGEEDRPVTKSEATGIAAAAAAAVVTSSSLPNNVPPSLEKIADDPEKMAAVKENGRVLLAASAGSGKTMLLTSRVAYLVQERNVPPERIFAVAFNRKAANEIGDRIAILAGDKTRESMTTGTMHKIFRRYIMQYGTEEQKAALTTWFSRSGKDDGKGVPSRAPSPATLGGTMARIWKECFSTDPPAGGETAISRWRMNNITPEQAKQEAIGQDELKLATWYEWVMGFKGVDKNWNPPCVRSNYKADKAWTGFLDKWRNGGRARIGDFSDMIVMFENLLTSNPTARKEIQAQFDHILVDEGQDLNLTQHRIISMMTEHIGDGSDGKSVWMVGDEIQSINSFLGAKPELFTQFQGKTDEKTGAPWKTLNISTNYRCFPEIVETANKLMSNHPRTIPMDAKPWDKKPRGKASIIVSTPSDHAVGALDTVTRIAQDIRDGEQPASDFAVLARTNRELNDYETACIVMGIPYGRRGGRSFLQAYETQTVLQYMDLITGTDFEKMQESLKQVFDKPNRFFLGARAANLVDQAIDARARRDGTSRTNVNPLSLFDPAGIEQFIRLMGSPPGWKADADRDQLRKMAQHLNGIKDTAERGTVTQSDGTSKAYSTQALIDDILAIPGHTDRGQPQQTLRDALMPVKLGQAEEEADAPPEEDEEAKKPVGNVAFLYMMAQPNPTRKDVDPSDPKQFKMYLDELEKKAADLRIDVNKWDEQQAETVKDPAKRAPPSCVLLSTVHSMKGAQFTDTTVVMAGGTFPMSPRKLKDEDRLSADQQMRLEDRRKAEFLVERQLAYVAMTRAKEKLTIVCPTHDRLGRPAGVSSFVVEAGLKVGENVVGKPEPQPVMTSESGGVKLASAFHYLLSRPPSDEGTQASSSTYDRRPS
jgi:superfamily I DNA/RNA helicase